MGENEDAAKLQRELATARGERDYVMRELVPLAWALLRHVDGHDSDCEHSECHPEDAHGPCTCWGEDANALATALVALAGEPQFTSDLRGLAALAARGGT